MKGVSEDLFHAVVPEKAVSIEDMEIMPVQNFPRCGKSRFVIRCSQNRKKSELQPIWAAFPMKS